MSRICRRISNKRWMESDFVIVLTTLPVDRVHAACVELLAETAA